MKVLTVTNMWPIQNSPYYGIFVKEQVEALNKYFPEITNRVYFINGKKSKLNYLWSIIRLNWLITFNKYDAIHIHYALSGIFLLFNPFYRKGIVLTMHGSDFNAKNSIIKRIVNSVSKRASHIVCLNDDMLSQLKTYNSKLFHIPCGVNTDTFLPVNLNKQRGGKYQIVFPSSRLRAVKNFPFFEAVVEHLEIKNNIEIEIIEIDAKTREEVNLILNGADLLCMTSITEGSPQIIKEAMCCGLPIVTSNVGDVKTLLKNVTNCFVIDNYDVEDYSTSIMQILTLPVDERSSNGRSKIFQLGIDEENTSRKLNKLYSSIK